MTQTALPYKLEQLDEIHAHGAYVKMSENDFSEYNVDDSILTSLVYLRNTGFDNIVLDFSDVSYEDRSRYLMLFLCGDVGISNCTLSDVWSQIFMYCLDNDFELLHDFVFFSRSELETFISENSRQIFDALSLFKSMVIYAIVHANVSGYSMSELNHTGIVPIGANIVSIVKHPLFISIVCKCYLHDDIKLQYFDKIFDSTDLDLLQAIDTTLLSFGIFLGFSNDVLSDRISR